MANLSLPGARYSIVILPEPDVVPVQTRLGGLLVFYRAKESRDDDLVAHVRKGRNDARGR